MYVVFYTHNETYKIQSKMNKNIQKVILNYLMKLQENLHYISSTVFYYTYKIVRV